MTKVIIGDAALYLGDCLQMAVQEPVAIVRKGAPGATWIEQLTPLEVGTKLYATPQEAVPAGWQLVPIEATHEMCIAAWGGMSNWREWALQYKNALAAAPKATP